MKINLDKKLEISSQIKNKYYTKIYFSFLSSRAVLRVDHHIHLVVLSIMHPRLLGVAGSWLPVARNSNLLRSPKIQRYNVGALWIGWK